MFRNPEEIRRRINEIVEKFRQKGATSPEKAMSLQELDLPPRFEQAMHRRLGQTGIFVEVNGKYYLNEKHLKQIQEQRTNSSSGGYTGNGRPPTWLRYAGILLMLPIGIIVIVTLYFFFITTGSGYYPGEFLIIILVVMLIVFAARMLLWRSRRRYWGQQRMANDLITDHFKGNLKFQFFKIE
jgi:hypothetical protein